MIVSHDLDEPSALSITARRDIKKWKVAPSAKDFCQNIHILLHHDLSPNIRFHGTNCSQILITISSKLVVSHCTHLTVNTKKNIMFFKQND